jgi:diketogulonate reductase-like aldo/keto reductase
MTHIDTAELYDGSEEIVGRVLKGRREQVFLVSKVLHENGSRAGVKAACERSLRKLGTDYLDGYLLHWNDGTFPLSETMLGLRDLVDEGKIKHLGVSNFEVAELEEATAALDGVPLLCNQVLYNLGDRRIEADVLPWCEARGVAVVGYSPYANSADFGAGTPGGTVLAGIASKHDRSVRQVVLRFLTRRPSLFAIPKASSSAHVEDNAGGQGFALDAEDLALIEAAFPA